MDLDLASRKDEPAANGQGAILLVSDDLMFPSRVREGLRPLGYSLKVAGTQDAALRAVSDAAEPPLAVLVNLTARRYDPTAVIRAFKADPQLAALPLLAFAGHVEKEKHEAAREAGANMVAANSSVSLHLGALLPRLLDNRGVSSSTTTDVIEIEE